MRILYTTPNLIAKFKFMSMWNHVILDTRHEIYFGEVGEVLVHGGIVPGQLLQASFNE